MTNFSIMDRVEWLSQAHGTWKEKSGVIVQVLQAGSVPDREKFYDLYHRRIGTGRRDISYVVRTHGRHYWPLTSKLRRVNGTPKAAG